MGVWELESNPKLTPTNVDHSPLEVRIDVGRQGIRYGRHVDEGIVAARLVDGVVGLGRVKTRERSVGEQKIGALSGVSEVRIYAGRSGQVFVHL